MTHDSLIHVPQHVQQRFSDQTMRWCSSDSEERFQQNLSDPAGKKLLEENGWIDKHISYEFNSQGFRSREPEYKLPGLMVFGCSFTMGIGLSNEQTWHSYISYELDVPVDNMGVIGASNGLMFRLAKYWVPKLRPNLVVWQKTFQQRFELIDQNDESNVLSPSNTTISGKDVFASWWYTDTNSEIDANRNEMAIRWICHQARIPLLILDIDEFLIDQQGKARDLEHAGPATHQRIARQLIDKMKSLDLCKYL